MTETSKSTRGILDVLFVIVCAVFVVGVLTVFGACGPKDDGTWMTCHWANMAVAGDAAVLLVLSIAHLAVGDAKIKMGLDIAAVPLAVLAALTPGILIGLCMMNTMQCHAVMRPAVIVMSVVVAIVAIADCLRQRGAGLPKRGL